ncbi:mediator of RNA polymerase II transcription subunit 15a isoform X2 [Capsella rubella]|uniref:mediator of RNA polymerase II transcription subunit 15a isoform X2 n=1 Tax=Capsella rubella TaxID=81985 RepID=UPI000CD4AAB3|nr:mediator of RNA polymerase II transcription subunit 15a isoform X2 [Capsella rubella]
MEYANGDDWREELFQKIRSMKEIYLPHVNDLYQRTVGKLHHQSLLYQQRSEHFEKLKQLVTMLESIIQFLSLPKSKIRPAIKDNVDKNEKKIICILEKHRLRQIKQSHVPAMQLNMSSSQRDPRQGSALNNANAGDWQEEIFQKIKLMKEMYLQDLAEIYQRVQFKLHQQDSIQQQQRSHMYEKLKLFEIMLEKMIQFLSVPKRNIMPAFEDKVAHYEQQIIGLLNVHRAMKPVQQGQLPQYAPVQDQPHDIQTNPQMQSMSMQGAGTWAQQGSLPNMQNNVLSSRPGVLAPHQNIPISIHTSSLASGQGNAVTNNGQQFVMGSINQPQLSSNLLQYQHVMQHQDQQMTQQLIQHPQLWIMQQQEQKQFQERQQAAQLQQGQQSQNQAFLEQMIPQLQLHQQFIPLQQYEQQREEVSGKVTYSLFPTQNVENQQRQVYQTQRALPEMPSNSKAQRESPNGGDWQEEVFQKIKPMKEMYLPDLAEMYHRVAVKLHQHLESIQQQERSDEFEKLEKIKKRLERMIHFLSVPKSSITFMPDLKDNVDYYEKQIIHFLNMHKPRVGGYFI